MSEHDAPIAGVKVVPLRRIPDERGTIFHMLRRTDPHFVEFGEIYFTSIYPGVVKGWHKHRDMTLNYACVHGRVKVALYDDREGSPTRGTVQEVFQAANENFYAADASLVAPLILVAGRAGTG